MRQDKKSTLLVEIGVEELPARFVPRAMEQLERVCETGLEKARLAFAGVKILATPRRLAILVNELAEAQRPDTHIFLGPPKTVAPSGVVDVPTALQATM